MKKELDNNPKPKHNVKVLCAVGDFENRTFNLPHKPDRSTDVELTTSTPIAQSTCYRLAGFSAQKLNRSTKEKKKKCEAKEKYITMIG